MMREEEFGSKIRAYLDVGEAELRPGLVYRLQQARSAALARASGEPLAEDVRELAGAAALVGSGRAAGALAERPLYAQLRIWLALGALAAAAFGYQQWTAWTALQELGDLDAQILSSDLPIDAYLDRGFQLWLKNPQLEP